MFFKINDLKLIRCNFVKYEIYKLENEMFLFIVEVKIGLNSNANTFTLSEANSNFSADKL